MPGMTSVPPMSQEGPTIVNPEIQPTVPTAVPTTAAIRHYISTDRILDEALPRFTRRAYLQIAARIVSLFVGITGVVMSVMMIIVDPLNSAAGGIAVAASGMACIIDGFVTENNLHVSSPRISLVTILSLDITMFGAALTCCCLIIFRANFPRRLGVDEEAWATVAATSVIGVSSLFHLLFAIWTQFDRHLANQKRDEIFAEMQERQRSRTV